MAPFNLTTSLLGLGLALAIVLLIRRDDLYLRHGIFWLLVALAAACFGLWPRSLDWIGNFVGVRYSPALALLAAVIALLIKALHADVTQTRLETEIRYLQQSVALLETELNALHARQSTPEIAQDRADKPEQAHSGT